MMIAIFTSSTSSKVEYNRMFKCLKINAKNLCPKNYDADRKIKRGKQILAWKQQQWKQNEENSRLLEMPIKLFFFFSLFFFTVIERRLRLYSDNNIVTFPVIVIIFSLGYVLPSYFSLASYKVKFNCKWKDEIVLSPRERRGNKVFVPSATETACTIFTVVGTSIFFPTWNEPCKP